MKTNDALKQSRRRFLQTAGAAVASLALGGLPLAARAAGETAEKKKIGVIGSGRVGGTVGELWLKAGHEVMFSSLDLEHDKALAARLGAGARLVRAFNCVGSTSMKSEAHRAGERLAISLAADDPAALQVAVRLVEDAGFEPVVVGGWLR